MASLLFFGRTKRGSLTIHLIPHLVDAVGWHYAFAWLAVGPFLGIWAMARLRAHPNATKLAGGRR